VLFRSGAGKAASKKGSRVQVIGAVKGSQAERIFEASGIQPFMEGATIVSVNGKAFKNLDEEGVMQCLRGARPLYITVKLSMEGWERLGVHRSILAKEKGTVTHTSPAKSSSSGAGQVSAPANMRKLRVVTVTFAAGPLGLKLKETRSCGGAVIITGFSRGADDQLLQAEAAGSLKVGMLMLAVAGQVVFGKPFEDVMQVIKTAARPVEMMFVPSPDVQFSFTTPPTDLVLGNIEGYVMVAAFKSSSGPAQEKKGLYPGMVILQVNKETIVSGMSLEVVEEMINRPFLSPMGEQAQGEGAAPKTKLAMRDMDSFMHLIRIRNGAQRISSDSVEQYVPE